MKKKGLSSVFIHKNDFSAKSGYGAAQGGKPVLLSALLWMVGVTLWLFRAYAVTPLTGLPDVLLIYLLVLACFYDGGAGVVTALCAGLVCDLLGSETIGLCTLFYTAAAFLPDVCAHDKKGRARWYFYLLAVFAVSEIALCFIGKICGGIFTVRVVWCAGRTILYGAVAGSLLLLFTAAGKKLK